jgi:hypothetical protein
MKNEYKNNKIIFENENGEKKKKKNYRMNLMTG